MTNSTVGRVAALDALADRLVKAPPNAWPSIAQSIQETASKLKGKAREYGDFYIEVLALSLPRCNTPEACPTIIKYCIFWDINAFISNFVFGLWWDTSLNSHSSRNLGFDFRAFSICSGLGPWIFRVLRFISEHMY